MKHKRLDRPEWREHNGIRDAVYRQGRLDCGLFRGHVSLLRLNDAAPFYWEFPKTGKAWVLSPGMLWLQLLPDGKKRLITCMYKPDKKTLEEKEYPYSASVWYVDVTDGYYADNDGVLVYVDKYLDVIFTPQGDVKVDDRDELDAALASGDINEKQYRKALAECESVIAELCGDVSETEYRCAEILMEALRLFGMDE